LIGTFAATERTAADNLTEPHLDSSALLVIDTQIDFLDDGTATIAGTSDLLPQIQQLIQAYRAAGRPVVHVIRLYDGEDVDLIRLAAIRAGARIVRPGSAGAQIAPSLLPDPDSQLDQDALLAGELQQIGRNEVVIWKPRWSAFYRTPLEDHLRRVGVDTVVIAGCNFPNCPLATIFDASERDYRVVIAENAISQITSDRLADALALGAHALTTQILVQQVADEPVLSQ
jgi:nicotinamidase-related amidase